MSRAFIDLHCHSKGSFDCLSDPRDIVKAAGDRGLTHLAITGVKDGKTVEWLENVTDQPYGR